MAMQVDPLHEYTSRLSERQKAVAQRDQQIDRLGMGRVLLGAVLLLGITATLGLGWNGTWLLIPVLGLIFLFALGRIYRTSRERLHRAARFYEQGIARLHGKPLIGGRTGRQFQDASHLYASDLDLFGPGSLFARLAQSQTAAGDQTLAGWLQQAAPRPTILARQVAIQELADRLELRESLAIWTGDLPEGISYQPLIDWAERTDAPPAAWRIVACRILGPIHLIVWILIAGGELPLLVGLALLLAILLLAGPLVGWIRSVESGTHEAMPNIWLVEALLARLLSEPFRTPRLAELTGQLAPTSPAVRLRKLRTLGEWQASRHNPLFAPVALLLLEPVRVAWGLSRWRAESGAQVRSWLAALGELEALNSLAGYAYENPNDTFPTIVESREPVLQATRLAHPLLSPHAVRNSVALGGDAPRIVFVSGSNMSGKSTLLRAVGTNIVLALMGAPVRAEQLTVSVVRLGATLRVEDSLQDGRSRFLAEVERVRAILEVGRAKEPLVLFLDELFSGTNSADRCAGAAGLLRELLTLHVIGFVTTHDLALTSLTETLADVQNVHFTDAFGANPNAYQMQPGVVPAGNGLALMRACGFDV